MYKLLILNKGSSVFAIQQSSIYLFHFTVNEQEVLNNIHLSVTCFLTYKLFFRSSRFIYKISLSFCLIWTVLSMNAVYVYRLRTIYTAYIRMKMFPCGLLTFFT